MATIKSYTDIEQSKVLAKILPLESADMNWHELPPIGLFVRAFPYKRDNGATEGIFPCWSLAALLSVLPKGEYKDVDLCFGGYQGDEYISEWFCSYEQQEPFIIEVCHADNPIDACYEMILKLHELKIL